MPEAIALRIQRAIRFGKSQPTLTKRIVRILTTESAGNNRLTYGKRPAEPQKNNDFPKTKTNHPDE